MRSSRFFITGTDTGVGKTVVSALLCSVLDAMYWKPIQTGARYAIDSRTVMQLAKLSAKRVLPEAYRFWPPVSPHLAASRAGVRISLRNISRPRLSATENLIVEGAGGVLVPISDTWFMSDLMRHLNLPVLLVTRTSLGTINHTLLSLAALRSAKLNIQGIIMVGKPNPDNRKAIEHYGETPVLGTVPILARLNRRALLDVFRQSFDCQVFFL